LIEVMLHGETIDSVIKVIEEKDDESGTEKVSHYAFTDRSAEVRMSIDAPSAVLAVDFKVLSSIDTSKFMVSSLAERAAWLEQRVIYLTRQMGIDVSECVPVNVPFQEEIRSVGRICCDGDGRLNQVSILLEGVGGARCHLDVSQVNSFAVFPGQIVAVQGFNASGFKILATGLQLGSVLPFASRRERAVDDDDNPSAMTAVVACGPFTSNESLDYSPLDELLQHVREIKPSLLILGGPFVDAKHPIIASGKCTQTFEQIFMSSVVQRINQALDGNSRTRLVILPSTSDIFHPFFCFPQPALLPKATEKLLSPSRVQSLSNPATFQVNGDVVFGMTTMDILLHLSGEEIAPDNSERVARLCRHLLRQQSYYPLFPAHSSVPLSLHMNPGGSRGTDAYANGSMTMPVTPDILVCPSLIGTFALDVDGCVCVNPGRLMKGSRGGTFAFLTITPPTPSSPASQSISDRIRCDIIRI
jgi:DNA polymerase alpha subunit B